MNEGNKNELIEEQESEKMRIVSRIVKQEADKYVAALQEVLGTFTMTPTISEKLHDAYVQAVGQSYIQKLSYEEILFYDEILNNPTWVDIREKLDDPDFHKDLKEEVAKIFSGTGGGGFGSF